MKPRVPQPSPTTYLCPGESHPIPRSVHLARLAGGFPPCRDCKSHCDSGLVPIDRVARWRTTEPGSAGIEVTSEGIRGRYLNDLHRVSARQSATAFARQLWSVRPWKGSFSGSPSSSSRQPLMVVVGHDERPTSPDLAVGIVSGLVQSGCRVCDVGLVSKSMWWWAAGHLGADGGLFVTGAGHPRSWTGLDVLGPGQSHVSESVLKELCPSTATVGGRPTRTAGSVESVPIREDYLVDLKSHFHALRPLKLIVATSSESVGRVLHHVFQGLPCQLDCAVGLEWSETHVSRASVESRLQARIVEGGGDVGYWIHEDGQTAELFDERGRSLRIADLAPLLCQLLTSEIPSHRSAPMLMTTLDSSELVDHAPRSTSAPSRSLPGWSRQPLIVRRSSSTKMTDFLGELHHSEALLGLDSRHRLWLKSPVTHSNRTTCDAIATLAAILRLLSWSDLPISQIVSSAVASSTTLSSATLSSGTMEQSDLFAA